MSHGASFFFFFAWHSPLCLPGRRANTLSKESFLSLRHIQGHTTRSVTNNVLMLVLGWRVTDRPEGCLLPARKSRRTLLFRIPQRPTFCMFVYYRS